MEANSADPIQQQFLVALEAICPFDHVTLGDAGAALDRLLSAKCPTMSPTDKCRIAIAVGHLQDARAPAEMILDFINRMASTLMRNAVKTAA
jgi:hypothetical protein